MEKHLQTRGSTKKFFLYLLGVIIITLQTSLSQAQLFTQNFDGAWPPVGPPAVSNPVGTGLADEGQTRWYRGDTTVLAGGTGNAGINPGRGGTGFAASFNTYDIASGGKADLIFNDIDLSTITPFAVLKFWLINKSGTDVIRVFARKGNDPWTQIGNASYGVNVNFTEISISLNAFSGAGFTAVDIRFEATSDYGNDNIGIDDVSIALPSPMSYVSNTSSQPFNDREVLKPLKNQTVIRMNVVTTGVSSPLQATTFYLNTVGTTNLAEISNATLWTTKGTSTFNLSTATQLGSVISAPNGSMQFTGITNELAEGNNFFWLTYDISSTATIGNLVDARFDSVLVAGVMRFPTIGNPTPVRIIQPAAIFHTNAGAGSTSGNGRGPTTQSLFNRTLSIYPSTDYANMKAGDSISTIGFNIISLGANPNAVSGNIKLYLQNTSDASFTKSTTWATAITDMTLVYDGPLTINPESGSYDIRLQNKFAYTGSNIYLGYDWALTTAVTSAAQYDCNSAAVGGSNGLRNVFGSTQGATLTGTSAFRPAVRFGVNAVANDVAVNSVYALTQMPRLAGSPHQIKAIVRNNGYIPVSTYSVALNISGANIMTSTKNVTLGFGQSTTVTFDDFTAINNGVNTITVSVGNDDANANNITTVTQVVNPSTYSYSEAGPATNSIGYNTGSGLLLNKYRANGGWLIDSVRAFISSAVSNDTKKVFGVVLNSSGTIIAKSDTFTIGTTDLGKLKSFAIVNPKVVYEEDFYVGLSQVANSAGYFPLGTQTESPARPGAYFTAASAGGTPTEASTFGRFMIEANTATPTPPQTVNIGVDTVICPGDSVILNAGNAGMTYLWSTGATTQTIVVDTTGTYSVTVRNAQGYPVTDTRVITLGPAAVSATISTNYPQGACVGTPITFMAKGLNFGSAPTYVWRRNNTIISGATGATYTSAALSDNDTIRVSVTSNSSCISGSNTVSASYVVDIFPILPVSVNIAANTSSQVCRNTSLTFTATPTNGGSTPTYQWTVNSSPISGETGTTFVTSTLSNNDTVRVRITPSESCDGQKLSNPIVVSILSPATANFTSTTSKRTVQFTNTFTQTANLMWNFGDGNSSTSANPTHTYAKDSSYTVTLMATNSCGGDTNSTSVVIKTKDFAATSINGLSSACALSNLAVIRLSVQNLRPDAAQNVSVAYQLNGGAINTGTLANLSGNGTATANFTQRANLSADGTYTIKAWVSDADDLDRSNDTVTLTVVNQARPNAAYTSQIGVNGSVSFANTTTSDVVATYAWDFGDNSTSIDPSPIHVYAQSGTYTVTMIATSACGSDTATSTITVIVVGIPLQANEKYVRAYPNPNNGLFNLTLQLSSADNINVNVYNANGQVVYTQKLGYINNENVALDLSTLSPGIYNVNIQGQNTQITKRINIVR
jgi:PKD repeat protein